MTTIYKALTDAGIPTDNWASDLYFPVTEESTAIVQKHHGIMNIKTFRNNHDGTLWYEAPFAYDPYWQRVTRPE